MTETPPQVAALLAASDLPRSEANRLMQELLGVSRSWLITHDQAELTAEQLTRWQEWVSRRRDGEPLAYILGWREFYGHRLEVTADVLIPRPDTETLVDLALELPLSETHGQVLDLGTGSGAIAIALALARPSWSVWASDISEDALAVARRNAARLHAPVQFLVGSWWQALTDTPAAGTRFDLVVSNPPYIPAGDCHLEQGDLRHEPRLALTDAADGLGPIRQIVAHAPAHLQPGGWLWLEHGYDQAEAVRAIFQSAGWRQVASRNDLAGIVRCTGARWPG